MNHINIPNGPFGMRVIDVFGPRMGGGELWVDHADTMDGKRTLIRVMDKAGLRVADALIDTGSPDMDEAKQWLLDFTRCSL
jgi:hypothetical protein